MAYTEFSLERVVQEFSLQVEINPLFEKVETQPLPELLTMSLQAGISLALRGGSEKARSEFIVAPVLLALRQISHERVTIYSGATLNADAGRGLNGECDFIVAEGIALPALLSPPILTLVEAIPPEGASWNQEAKKQDIELGLGQCVAQMLGAMQFNKVANKAKPCIYGCVTSAEVWQFLKLEGTQLTIDSNRYILTPLEYTKSISMILGVFLNILAVMLEN
jgi:hypothetical protein